MTAVLARLGVLLAIACLAWPAYATDAIAKAPPPKAHAAAPIPGPCAAMYWSNSYADECHAYLRRALEGDRMSSNLRNCLINAGITTGFVAIGGIIGGVAARAIAGGIVGAGGTACVAAIRGG